ncbi:hypothetical protein ACR3H8_20135 [Pseudomonas aeruginosa]|uniref:hypothetical protein n=1 Tax=Pseudomonas aeruginosa group TaxID=136841 RepID=UPI0003BB1A05|nr:hypothetical protein [Pseudomonas aeruginosa]EIU2716097.1 hypothetical protein [Pseudomonas aeruginosa]EIU2863612.1 hypothetical protein [Pseudomonas aeruginosa]ELD5772823.1 hypothetical protein [Pseudomonas aeruginosa]ERW61345.1 hypothetical protein Q024_06392 [Pseudomonas aeruginosa BWHPSA011]ETV28820.1 hypothetical protein Q046_05737 [Pseudomonas aeruginosa BWHPSA041]
MPASQVLQFQEVIEHYHRLLVANPGKALVILAGGNAAVLQDDVVYGAPTFANGTVDKDNLYELDIDVFDVERGCWCDESPIEGWARINKPTFIDLTA